VITWSNHGLSYALVSSLSNVKTSALGLFPLCRFTVPSRSLPSAHRWVTNPTIRFSWARCGAGCQLRPLLGIAGAWALKMLPSAIMPSRWSCLSSQMLNQNVMRFKQFARGNHVRRCLGWISHGHSLARHCITRENDGPASTCIGTRSKYAHCHLRRWLFQTEKSGFGAV
jgi:hypothetical protein